MQPLPLTYYRNNDVVWLARDLIGKRLITTFNGKKTSGYISETEAYKGTEDKACHAYNHRRTKRNEVMYHEGGKAYVFMLYGIHFLFNIVSNIKGIPDAVLIRGISPLHGIDVMEERLKRPIGQKGLNGPGILTRAMGIDRLNTNGKLLDGPEVWLENGINIPHRDIFVSKRIGIDYAEEYASKLWRFHVSL